jgi:hypothetical protein
MSYIKKYSDEYPKIGTHYVIAKIMTGNGHPDHWAILVASTTRLVTLRQVRLEFMNGCFDFNFDFPIMSLQQAIKITEDLQEHYHDIPMCLNVRGEYLELEDDNDKVSAVMQYS